MESLHSVARKLRGSGRIKEYQALKRQAHIREKAVKQLEAEFEPSYGWRLDDPELARPSSHDADAEGSASRGPSRRQSAGPSGRQRPRGGGSGGSGRTRALSSMS